MLTLWIKACNDQKPVKGLSCTGLTSTYEAVSGLPLNAGAKQLWPTEWLHSIPHQKHIPAFIILHTDIHAQLLPLYAGKFPALFTSASLSIPTAARRAVLSAAPRSGSAASPRPVPPPARRRDRSRCLPAAPGNGCRAPRRHSNASPRLRPERRWRGPARFVQGKVWPHRLEGRVWNFF